MPTAAFPSLVVNPPRYDEPTIKAAATEIAEDTTAGSVTYPVVKTVEATFTYIGKLEPTPIPDLED